MPSSTMRTVVFQAAAIYMAVMMFMYHFGLNLFDQVKRDEGFQSMTSALNSSAHVLLNQTTYAIMNVPFAALMEEKSLQAILGNIDGIDITIASNATTFDVLNQTVNAFLDKAILVLTDDEAWQSMLDDVYESNIMVKLNTTELDNSTALAPVIHGLNNETKLEQFLAAMDKATALDLTSHPEVVASLKEFLAGGQNGTVQGDLLETYKPLIEGIRNGTVIMDFLSNFENVSNMRDLFTGLENGTVLSGFPDLAQNATDLKYFLERLQDGSILDDVLAILSDATGMGDILGGSKQPLKTFYGVYIPQEMVISIILSALRYYWYIFLQRMLPARRRIVEIPIQPNEKEGGAGKHRKEDKVFEKPTAKSPTRRHALNWCNTILKWVLQLTIGQMLFNATEHIIRGAFFHTPPHVILQGLRKHFSLNFSKSFLSLDPWTHLLAFTFIPAHKQIVFLAAADLVVIVVFTAVVQQVVGWALKTDVVQMMMRDATRSVVGFDVTRLNFTAWEVLRDEL